MASTLIGNIQGETLLKLTVSFLTGESGNRDDYKLIPNSEREWEIEAFVQLLEDLRSAIGPAKILSVAVPGLERDLMAFTASTVPRIAEQVDFINVMTYDLMNRRDTSVKHHSGVAESRDALQRYAERGASPRMLNLGWGTTSSGS